MCYLYRRTVHFRLQHPVNVAERTTFAEKRSHPCATLNALHGNEYRWAHVALSTILRSLTSQSSLGRENGRDGNMHQVESFFSLTTKSLWISVCLPRFFCPQFFSSSCITCIYVTVGSYTAEPKCLVRRIYVYALRVTVMDEEAGPTPGVGWCHSGGRTAITVEFGITGPRHKHCTRSIASHSRYAVESRTYCELNSAQHASNYSDNR